MSLPVEVPNSPKKSKSRSKSHKALPPPVPYIPLALTKTNQVFSEADSARPLIGMPMASSEVMPTVLPAFPKTLPTSAAASSIDPSTFWMDLGPHSPSICGEPVPEVDLCYANSSAPIGSETRSPHLDLGLQLSESSSQGPPEMFQTVVPSSSATPRPSAGREGGTRPLKAYAKRRGELLDVLNSLHSTGIQNELDLPQIVVVGSQSVGKSSLIESMSGITLPRSAGTCTKCPMECHLQSSPTWSCTVLLRFQYDLRGAPLAEVQEHPFGTFFDKSMVETTIRRAQKAILNPSKKPGYFLDKTDLEALDINTPDELSFSPNCVCIRVAGPSVPDLYFYDLPGIIANVKDGGNEDDIRAVEDIAKRYINRPNCLVLLVISCETDFENQGAGRLVLRDPRLRGRTVGVLTKTDRIEPGTTHKWLATLKNEENNLQNGWFAVKQPGHRDLESGISWEDARAKEEEFFTQTEPWASLSYRYRQHLGSVALSEHLSRILSDLVSKHLPFIRTKVTTMLVAVKNELDELPLPASQDPRREVLTLLREFVKAITKHVNGLAPLALYASSEPGLMYKVNEAYGQFRIAIHRTAPRFRPWETTYGIHDAQKLQRMAASADEHNDSKGNGIKLHTSEVMNLAKRARTRELPGNVPFSVKEFLVKETTKEWGKLAHDCFKEVDRIFSTHLDELLKEHFKLYIHGGLVEDVGAILREQLQRRVELVNEKIDALCLLEDQSFTQNEHYFFDYRTKFLTRYKSLLRESRGHSGLIDTLNAYNATLTNQDLVGRTTWSNINTTLSSLATIGIHVKAPDLAKLLPSESTDPALEIMAEVRAYFQVAYKRFSDVIPQQIDAAFLRGFDTSLDIAVLSMDLSEENCIKWLSESPKTAMKRKELLGKLKRLELAKIKLSQHHF